MNRLVKTSNNATMSIKSMINNDKIKERFENLLGSKAPKFLTSLLNVVNNDKLLTNANPDSIMKSALIAATLDLPIDKNLGFAYIVPYKDEAQFQLGYKGLLQLAMRSGQFLKINIAHLYEGQLTSYDPIKDELVYNLNNKKSDNITHFIGYFKLLNGFEKYMVMSKEEIEDHGKKYSKAYNYLWKSNFEAMANKTVIKLLLSKYAPLSIEMQTAVKVDQAVIKEVDENNVSVDYVDNAFNNEATEQIDYELITEDKDDINEVF